MAFDTNPIKYSDLIKADDSITDLIKQLDELSDAYKNMANNIKQEAANVAANLKMVSGATEQGREATRKASADADKLARAQRDLAFAESENAKKLAELKQAQREANQINKLMVQLNQSAEGSYNRLSAQYSLNKIYLNNMSLEERKATEAGRQLEAETKELYEEMKRLQEATGKHQLNVGNYAEMGDKAVSLKSRLRELREELALMEVGGKRNSEEYKQMRDEAAMLQDALGDVNQQTKILAHDNSGLQGVISGLQGAAGAFEVAQGVIGVFTDENEELEKVLVKIQSAMAIANGIQQVANVLNKDSAFRVVTLARAKEFLTATTSKLSVALGISNVAAKALMATLTLGVSAAITALIFLFDKLATSQSESKQATEDARKTFEKYQQDVASNAGTAIAKFQDLRREYLALRTETEKVKWIEKNKTEFNNWGISINNVNEAEKIMRTDTPKVIKSLELRAKAIALQNLRIQQYEDHYKAIIYLDKQATKVNMAKVGDTINVITQEMKNAGITAKDLQEDLEETLSGAYTKVYTLTSTAVNKLNAYRVKQSRFGAETAKGIAENVVAQTNASINKELNLIDKEIKSLGVITEPQKEKTKTKQKDTAKQAQKDAEKEYQERLKITRKREDEQLKTEKDIYKKQRTEIAYNYNRQIEDLRHYLEITKNITTEERNNINATILALEEQQTADLLRLDKEQSTKEIEATREGLALKLEAVRSGSQEEYNLRLQQIANEEKLAKLQNEQRAESERLSETDITAKYDAQRKALAEEQLQLQLTQFDQQQKLAESEFNLLQTTEQQKTIFKLNAEKERWEKILQLNEISGKKLSQIEVATIKNTVIALNNQIKSTSADTKGKDIYDLFGLKLDEDKKKGLNETFKLATEQINNYMGVWKQATEQKVANADREVESAQNALQAEMEARAQGYANNVEQAQKELELSKRNREKALKDQQRQQRVQIALDAALQMSNLITASTEIWKLLKLPWLAIPAIALMWGSFAATKIKALEMTKQGSEKYADGTVELLQGGSHQSGNDVDLGTKADGTKRRAEGGEYFAVINKRNSRKYGETIPNIINSLNNGTFEEKYHNAYKGVDNVTLSVNNNMELGEIKNDVRAIREQHNTNYYINEKGQQVVQYKNLKRTFLK